MQTRCNPKLNYQLIDRFKAHPQFRSILGSIGLESLLDLKVRRLQRDLCAELARRVDVSWSMLTVNGEEIPLTYASVTKVLGFPCAGPSAPFRKDINLDDFINACMKFNLHKAGRISHYELWAYLDGAEGENPFDDEFKAKFLLFCIATLLKPTTNVQMHFKEYISMLYGMDQLSNFNWAKFVVDGLLDAVKVFQVRNAKSLGCCLLYLQVRVIEYHSKAT